MLLFSGEHGRFSVDGESNLRVDSVLEADTALYTCRASNEQDFVDAHALLTVLGNVAYVTCWRLIHLSGCELESDMGTTFISIPTLLP